MTAAAPRPIAKPRVSDPATDRRLAAVHLRVGQLGLARAELEALAGTGKLDGEGLLTLAEARWRTGDLAGAGEAAQAYLASGGEAIVALVIAAEATAAVGRPGEARRLVGQVLERADVPLDRIFAGMPRSAIWPADPSEAGRPAGTLFPTTGEASMAGWPPAAAATPALPPMAAANANPADPGLWDAGSTRDGPVLPEASVALDAGAIALGQGRDSTAAVHLAIALRLGPELAPAVLDQVDRAAQRTPELELVRGDAYRIVGHEAEARRAYAAASAGTAARAEAAVAAAGLAPGAVGGVAAPDADLAPPAEGAVAASDADLPSGPNEVEP